MSDRAPPSKARPAARSRVVPPECLSDRTLTRAVHVHPSHALTLYSSKTFSTGAIDQLSVYLEPETVVLIAQCNDFPCSIHRSRFCGLYERPCLPTVIIPAVTLPTLFIDFPRSGPVLSTRATTLVIVTDGQAVLQNVITVPDTPDVPHRCCCLYGSPLLLRDLFRPLVRWPPQDLRGRRRLRCHHRRLLSRHLLLLWTLQRRPSPSVFRLRVRRPQSRRSRLTPALGYIASLWPTLGTVTTPVASVSSNARMNSPVPATTNTPRWLPLRQRPSGTAKLWQLQLLRLRRRRF